MGYSLTPVIVDLKRVKALMGSKDAATLQAVIKKYRRDMLDMDAMGDWFDEFEKEHKADYKAFAAGDFSGVDLNATYPEPEPEEEDDEETAAMRAEFERLNKKDPEAGKKFLFRQLKDIFADPANWEDDDEEEEPEPFKEVSTGTALAHLILGGKPDKRNGYKYGYALYHLCEYLGTVPDHDKWCSLRSSSNFDDALDKVLKKARVSPESFSVSKFLINRGSPVQIPTPDDFPFIGYLKRAEIRQILPLIAPDKIEGALRAKKGDDREWVGEMIEEFRTWLEACVKTDQDLICFYF